MKKPDVYLLVFESGMREKIDAYADGRSIKAVINKALNFFFEHHKQEGGS